MKILSIETFGETDEEVCMPSPKPFFDRNLRSNGNLMPILISSLDNSIINNGRQNARAEYNRNLGCSSLEFDGSERRVMAAADRSVEFDQLLQGL